MWVVTAAHAIALRLLSDDGHHEALSASAHILTVRFNVTGVTGSTTPSQHVYGANGVCIRHQLLERAALLQLICRLSTSPPSTALRGCGTREGLCTMVMVQPHEPREHCCFSGRDQFAILWELLFGFGKILFCSIGRVSRVQRVSHIVRTWI
ncbi:hypothetical protein BAUCODRAFT_237195 [Baudoinia panamericana UAMH 10762]|uniref:Uncharacterized protein n=1 Tax=Baudoinia panamericana (strain UAMH 10762) TaxID=717646 RepID=M2MA23_BAUPA|nr:uncharacterized protein BAUCODRAFT_237195 [Baudoinia panamericana UAMH 10762]EMC93321.1 hypothetical protein BAUCODRAFT_237195 [Baudoinia panamericana UAMH 10762]